MDSLCIFVSLVAILLIILLFVYFLKSRASCNSSSSGGDDCLSTMYPVLSSKDAYAIIDKKSVYTISIDGKMFNQIDKDGNLLFDSNIAPAKPIIIKKDGTDAKGQPLFALYTLTDDGTVYSIGLDYGANMDKLSYFLVGYGQQPTRQNIFDDKTSRYTLWLEFHDDNFTSPFNRSIKKQVILHPY